MQAGPAMVAPKFTLGSSDRRRVALARWTHSELGLIGPATFIPFPRSADSCTSSGGSSSAVRVKSDVFIRKPWATAVQHWQALYTCAFPRCQFTDLLTGFVVYLERLRRLRYADLVVRFLCYLGHLAVLP